jgi:hypothetical protein
VFTARYAQGPYIKQIRFVFKGLMFPFLSLGRYDDGKAGNESHVINFVNDNCFGLVDIKTGMQHLLGCLRTSSSVGLLSVGFNFAVAAQR